MTSLPLRLYTAAQSRAVDRCAIEEHGLPGPLLMARAARTAFELLLEREPEPELLQVLCGPGNNGGDGLLLAVLAQGRGIPVRVLLVGGESRSDDARAAAEKARSSGLELRPFEAAALDPHGVVVDAMLGTGISGAPRAAFAEAIDAVNALGVPVLALDVPSGVNSDTGHAEGPAIRATWTISFITAKAGLFTGDGAALAGERTLNDLAVPLEAYAVAGPAISVLDRESLISAMPSRAAGAHKGDFGRCLLVGGDDGMGGAIILAAEAALRTGVGLARAATRAAHIPPLLARRPECMVAAVDHRNHLLPLLDWPSAVVIGPGLGQAPWGEQMLHGVMASGRPLVVDADALNLLAADARPLPDGSIITPHPGEAARLLGCNSDEIQANRFAAATSLAQRFNAVVVLKGQGTIVATADQSMLCAAGNPGMASGGMGDVLSGILGSLLAQGLPAWDAARLGTLLHSEAADRAAAEQGMASLLASDLFPALAELLP